MVSFYSTDHKYFARHGPPRSNIKATEHDLKLMRHHSSSGVRVKADDTPGY